MKNIAIMDTSVMSFNHGDQIIMESCERALAGIMQDSFVVHMPTHSPLFRESEFNVILKDGFAMSLDMFDLKFICGTNILGKDRLQRRNNWNMRISDTKHIKDFIFVGVGTDGLPCIKNNYTKRFYQSALSHQYVHSVRDEKTKIVLEGLGFKALNTGCATLWPLTKEYCETITTEKSDTAILTLTDYCRDYQADTYLIDILCKNYKNVFFWAQGIFDNNYFEEIKGGRKIKCIPPSLKAYDEFLERNECDFVGTRLHAGIKAMQRGRRSLIIGVDNRARDMAETHNINYLERSQLTKLEQTLKGKIITSVTNDYDKIEEFLRQFL